MTNLPVEQIGESQRLATQLHVEPEAKVMQSDFRRQARLKAVQRVRAFTSQPEGIEQLVIDGLNDLTQPSQPASPGFGPAHFTALVRRADHLCTILRVPAAMQVIACKAFISDIDALRRSADTGQTRRGMPPNSKEGFGQRMVIATGGGEAKAGDHTRRGNRGEQMEALIPTNAIAPADIGLSGQPSAATSLGISRGNARTVQRFIQATLRLQLVHQVQTESHDDIALLTLQAIELLALRQGRKRRSQVAQRVAIEGAFAGKVRPLAKDRQRHHFATRQRRLWS